MWRRAAVRCAGAPDVRGHCSRCAPVDVTRLRTADLSGQVHAVVGALGPVYAGITTRLLDAGSVVVAAGRNVDLLDELQSTLGRPVGLITVNETPSTTEGAEALQQYISTNLGRLDGVIAHGGLVHSHAGHPWEPGHKKTGFELEQGRSILYTTPDEVMAYVQSLVAPHVGAAHAYMPLLEQQAQKDPRNSSPSYTVVTGGLNDGRIEHVTMGAEGPALTAMYGFGLALRCAASDSLSSVRVNELRIGMQLNRSEEERFADPRGRPLTTDIGSLATYVAESNLSGLRLRCSDDVELEGLLHHFGGFQQ